MRNISTINILNINIGLLTFNKHYDSQHVQALSKW